MNRLLRNNFRGIAFIAAAVMATSACVKQESPGVGLVKFDSSAVFGASKGQGDIPGFGTPNPFADQFALPDLPVRDLIKRVADVVTGPCPTAKITDYPKESAGVTIKSLPPVGLYKWKRVLSATKTAADGLRARPLALQAAAIRRVVVANDHDFTFDMLSPDPFVDGNTVITTFRVNSNPDLLFERTLTARTIGVVDVPGADVRVRPLQDVPGLYITKIVTQNASGVNVSTFAPVVEVMVLPLDGGVVRSGQTFRSIGIDATSGTVLTNDGLVGRTSRVDACGEIVEGYVVSLTQTYSGDFGTTDPTGSISRFVSRTQTRHVDYVFATQYGALPIAVTLAVGDIEADPTAFYGHWELGGLSPAPLPDKLK